MSHKFNAATVITSVLDTATNNTRIEFLAASSGEKFTLNMSPEATERTLEVLLSRPSDKSPLRPFLCKEFKTGVLRHNYGVLMCEIGKNQAIPLLLSKDALLHLKDKASELLGLLEKSPNDRKH